MKKRLIILIIVIIVAIVVMVMVLKINLADNGNHMNTNSNTPTPEPNIRVTSPTKNEVVGLPLIIKGEARVFENQLNYRLRDENRAVLIEDNAMAASPDMGKFGPFEIEATYPEPKGNSGTVEVFDYSAKDGSQIDTVAIPVQFKKVESLTVKVFFGNSQFDPGVQDCSKVFGVTRRIAKTQAVARAALEELLRGPLPSETNQGYFTSINTGVKLQKITIENGVARVDFDETLESQVGGSCRVAAIASQIRETLKQFPSVQSVVISIDGRTEDILQP